MVLWAPAPVESWRMSRCGGFLAPHVALVPTTVGGGLANVKGPTTVVIAQPPTTIKEVENPLANIDTIEQITDPAERAREVGRRLAEIPKFQERLRALRQSAVLEMRRARLSYAEIGRQLGLHRNRVQQIAEGRTAGGQGGQKAENHAN